jgi:hypothetical protein
MNNDIKKALDEVERSGLSCPYLPFRSSAKPSPNPRSTNLNFGI